MNRLIINSKIDPANLQAIFNHLNAISKLLPFLVELTAKERQEIFKMNEKRVEFVNKGIIYMPANPKLIPDGLDPAQVERDYQLFNDLKKVLARMVPLASLILDSRIIAGSQAVSSTLAFYETAQTGIRLGIPNAEEIVKDMGKLFARDKSASSEQDEDDLSELRKAAGMESEDDAAA